MKEAKMVSLRELKKEISRVFKSLIISNPSNVSSGKRNEYLYLCDAIWNNHSLFFEFFSLDCYVNQHIELALMLYVAYGIKSLQKIQECTPNYCGATVTNWDGFLIALFKKMNSIYSLNHHVTELLDELDSVCDNDLKQEILSYVSTSKSNALIHNEIRECIDFDFIMRRARTMGQDQNSMMRYVHLIEVLAVTDYTSAFQAWGEFYYIFEKVYIDNQPARTAFTSALYNAFFVVPQRKTLIRNQKDMEVACEKGRKLIDETIYDYGWKVLHHLFELMPILMNLMKDVFLVNL